MAVAKTLCDGTILIEDGTTPTALSVTVAMEPGNFTFTPPRDTFTDIIDRCAIVGSRKSGTEPGTLSFSYYLQDFTQGTGGTLIDLIDGTGAFAARVSTDSGEFEGNVLKVTYTMEGSDHGGTDGTIVCSKVRLWWDFAEGQPNVVNVTGVILADPTFTGPS